MRFIYQPSGCDPILQIFNTFHCKAQLSACHFIFFHLDRDWMHSAHGIYMDRENPGYSYLSLWVYLLSWGLKNGTVLFMSLHYFILYYDKFLVFFWKADWMSLNIKQHKSVQGLFWHVIIGDGQTEAAAQNDWLLGGLAMLWPPLS